MPPPKKLTMQSVIKALEDAPEAVKQQLAQLLSGKFVIPDDVKDGKPGEPPLAKATLTVYKKHLNQLAERGYNMRDDLLSHQQKVVDLINELIPGDTKIDRDKKRKYYSSIFWILSNNKEIASKQIFYNAFQKVKENYVDPSWMSEDAA